MKAHRTLFRYLAGAIALSSGAWAQDAEGCKDLKPFPRPNGCVISECSWKQRDAVSIQMQADDTKSMDAAVNSVTYSCPASVSPQQIAKSVTATLRENSYQIVYQEKDDPSSTGMTARKGTQWIKFNAGPEDNTTTYSLTAADAGPEKPAKADTCTVPQVASLEKKCVIVECYSNTGDTVQMKTSAEEQTSLEGPLVEATLACSESKPTEIFDAALKSLREGGFEIVFTDRSRPENSALTVRSGKRWVELTDSQDGESISYVLTVVPTAETVVDGKPHVVDAGAGSGKPSVPIQEAPVKPPPQVPPAVPATSPAPRPEPPKQPEPVSPPRTAPPKEPPPVTPPVQTPSPAAASPVAAPKPAPSSAGPITPPKPLVEVPMEVSDKLKRSVVGELIITVHVEVDAEGKVTKAALAGKITKTTQKFETVALDAVRRWRFEPARQGEQPVAGETSVQLRVEGEVIRTNIPLMR